MENVLRSIIECKGTQIAGNFLTFVKAMSTSHHSSEVSAMQEAPLITVVIPTLNRRDLVKASLNSVISQTGARFNLIIVDNGSTDGTLEAISGIKATLTNSLIEVSVVTELTPGACAARNAGLKLVKTPWVMFFDSDDTMLPGHMLRVKQGILTHGSADIIGWNVEHAGADKATHILPFDPTMRKHLHRASLSTHRYAARTELLREVGGWNESLSGWNDFELGVRLLLNSPTAITLSGCPTVRINAHADSITGTDFSHSPRKWEESLRVIERHLSSTEWQPHVRAVKAKLAGMYAHENHPELAAPLLAESLASASHFLKLKLKLIYHTVRLIGHGGSLLALTII